LIKVIKSRRAEELFIIVIIIDVVMPFGMMSAAFI